MDEVIAVYGADPDWLDEFAIDLAAAAAQLETLGRAILDRLGVIPWAGPDAVPFTDAVVGYASALAAATGLLRDMAAAISRNATEQRWASSASDGSGVDSTALGTRSSLVLEAGPRRPAPGIAHRTRDELRHLLEGGQALWQWANTERDLPNTGFVTGPGELVQGVLLIDEGIALFRAAPAAVIAGPEGGLVLLPLLVGAGLGSIGIGGAYIYDGGSHSWDAIQHPTERKTPIQWALDAASDLTPVDDLAEHLLTYRGPLPWPTR